MRARCTFPLVAMCAALGVATAEAAPAADLEVDQLRRDIRELERTVAAQARRIDQLERAVSRSSVTIGDAAAPAASAEADDSATPAWLAAERWQGIEIGMSAQDAIALLGPPTAVRIGTTAEERILLYTLELDANAFLSGQLRVRDDQVTAVERPRLK